MDYYLFFFSIFGGAIGEGRTIKTLKGICAMEGDFYFTFLFYFIFFFPALFSFREICWSFEGRGGGEGTETGEGMG